MKARVFKTENQIRKIVQDEANKRTTEMYEEAVKDVSYQCFAVMMYVLTRYFGFGKKRLHKVKNLTESEFMLMKIGILGRHYDANDCVRYLKEKYDIDFSKSQYDESWNDVTRRNKK